MKQFFLVLLVCMAGFFLAPTVLGIKTTSARRYENAGTYVESSRPMYAREVGKWNKYICQTTLTMALDLDEAEKVSTDTKLVTIVGSSKEIGLMMTKQGLVGNWEGNPWGSDKGLPLADLMDNPNVVRVKGGDCLVLSVIVNGSNSVTKETPGITVVDASGKVLLSYPPLNSSDNETYRSIDFNDNLVSHVMIAPRLLSVKAAGKRAARLEKSVVQKPGNALLGYGGGGVMVLLLTAIWCRGLRRKSAVSQVMNPHVSD